MVDISVGNNPYIQYTPSNEQAAKASQTGDLGKITSVVSQDNKLVVTTDKGTLTLTGPALEKYKGEFSVGDFVNAKDAAGELMRSTKVTIAAIMILFIEIELSGQQDSREVKMATKEMEWAKMEAAIDKFKEAAWMNFAAGMCTATAQGFGGAMTLGSAAAGSKAIKNAPTGQDPGITAQKARIASSGWDAAGAFGQAGGTGLSSTFQLLGGLATAGEKSLEAESKKFGSMADMATDFQRSQVEAAKKVMDMLSSMLDTDFQTKQKILA